MKLFTALVAATLLLFSCNHSTVTPPPKNADQTPQALQDGKTDILSSRSRMSILDELYEELTAANPALKQLRTDIAALYEQENAAGEVFNNYNGKSVGYYDAATTQAASLTDTVLQQKMMALLNTSQQKYAAKTAELNALRSVIAANNISIRDKQTVLKIALTLPLIEQYQSNHLPDKKTLSDFAAKQNKVITAIDSLNPLK